MDEVMREIAEHPEAAVEIDGEPMVVFHVIGASVALKRADGKVMLASVERVRRAWLAQEIPRREP